MANTFETLSMYFQYPFVRYALIVGVLISLCSSILGVSLVLKRLSYIGDSLSHTAFGLMAVATLIGFIDDMVFVLISTVIVSIFITKNAGSSEIKGDAMLTVMSVGSLGIGYLIMNVANVSSNLAADVCVTLFGSTAILTLSIDEVYLCIVLSIVVTITYILFYNKLFAITFDEDFSKATGVNVALYNMLISVILAIIIVLAINLVGSLLISALIIFPALSAMRVFNNFKSVIICSAIFSVICSSSGILISILYGTPVGSTIVAVDLAGFVLFSIIGKLRR